jgi:hypothetical protein
MKKGTAILFSAIMIFLGIIIGFLFAPIKNGINMNIGSNSGNEYEKITDDGSDRDLFV